MKIWNVTDISWLLSKNLFETIFLKENGRGRLLLKICLMMPLYVSATKFMSICHYTWTNKTYEIEMEQTPDNFMTDPTWGTCDHGSLKIIITPLLTSKRYLKMEKEFVLLELEMDVGDLWFNQDGTTAHTVRNFMFPLREHFPVMGHLKWFSAIAIFSTLWFFLGTT